MYLIKNLYLEHIKYSNSKNNNSRDRGEFPHLDKKNYPKFMLNGKKTYAFLLRKKQDIFCTTPIQHFT